MLVSFRSCGPRDHSALLKLVLAYNRFEKTKANRKSLSQGLNVLLRNPSQGKMWLLEVHKKPVGYALLTYNFELEYGGAEGGLRDFQLQVPRRNKSAEVFYRKAGFRELPRRVMMLEVRPEHVVQVRRAS